MQVLITYFLVSERGKELFAMSIEARPFKSCISR
jgi:hypothetical protein